MRIGQREFPIARIPQRIMLFARSLAAARKLKRPVHSFVHYVRLTSPGQLEFRDGLKLSLSSHPHDLVTVFNIHLRGDYGTIRRGSVVVDVGANIGAFAIYAARCGAERVYAFEPNCEAFETLCKNIAQSGLEGVVLPFHLAVSGRNGRVKFPKRASPYNRILGEAATDPVEFDFVDTVALGEIVASCQIERIDLLKLDCEGAEFDIVAGLDDATCSRIREIRMEYHRDPAEGILDILTERGFRTVYQTGPPSLGMLWLKNGRNGKCS